jgi:hypothetical protein
VDETDASGKKRQRWTRRGDDGWVGDGTQQIRRHYSVSADGNVAYVTAKKNEAMTIQYEDGNWRDFVWTRGKLTAVVEKTGEGVATWKRQGDTNTWLSGQTSEQRLQVNVSLDGDYSYVDDKGKKHLLSFDGTEDKILPTDLVQTAAVKKAHEDLAATVRQEFTTGTTHQDAFIADMDAFERRAQAFGLKEQQVLDTYAELQKLIVSSESDPKINKVERRQLAKEVMHHVAQPRNVDQGDHDTCGAAVAEVVVVAHTPEKFASTVRQIADRGSFITQTGKTVELDSSSMNADSEASDYGINPYNKKLSERSYASQLYQIAGINAGFEAQNKGLRYTQIKPVYSTDKGERTVDAKTGEQFTFIGLYPEDVEAIIRETSGVNVPVLQRGRDYNTPEEFAKKITDAQLNSQMPMVLWVNAKQEPFWTATGKGRGGNDVGGHFVTVWDVDSESRALVDNQWGRKSDYESLRRLPMRKLYESTTK